MTHEEVHRAMAVPVDGVVFRRTPRLGHRPVAESDRLSDDAANAKGSSEVHERTGALHPEPDGPTPVTQGSDGPHGRGERRELMDETLGPRPLDDRRQNRSVESIADERVDACLT